MNVPVPTLGPYDIGGGGGGGGGEAEKGGAMGISDYISRGVRGYAPPEIFEI